MGNVQRLGFEEFTTEVEDVLKDHKKQVKASRTADVYGITKSY